MGESLHPPPTPTLRGPGDCGAHDRPWTSPDDGRSSRALRPPKPDLLPPRLPLYIHRSLEDAGHAKPVFLECTLLAYPPGLRYAPLAVVVLLLATRRPRSALHSHTPFTQSASVHRDSALSAVLARLALSALPAVIVLLALLTLPLRLLVAHPRLVFTSSFLGIPALLFFLSPPLVVLPPERKWLRGAHRVPLPSERRPRVRTRAAGTGYRVSDSVRRPQLVFSVCPLRVLGAEERALTRRASSRRTSSIKPYAGTCVRVLLRGWTRG
ncbi:hypothetical protein B0H11DRAFT_2309549 [Mycena galericulata]|nr:hypothetical protein B0H11DRAFT_2309549 [Mycena galericulata]